MVFEVLHHDADGTAESWGTFEAEEDARRFIAQRCEPEESFEIAPVEADRL